VVLRMERDSANAGEEEEIKIVEKKGKSPKHLLWAVH